MFEGLNRWLGKKQIAEMAGKIPNKPDAKRTKKPDLATWMGEAESAGLDGEVGNGEELNMSVGDLKNQPDMTTAGTPDRHGLHLVTPEENGEPIDDDVLEKPAANLEPLGVETPDPMETELTEKLAALKAQKIAIENAMAATEAELSAYQAAKDKVDRTAA